MDKLKLNVSKKFYLPDFFLIQLLSDWASGRHEFLLAKLAKGCQIFLAKFSQFFPWK